MSIASIIQDGLKFTRLAKPLDEKGVAYGILDYRVAPFALGDTITWLMNFRVKRNFSKCDRGRIFLICDPDVELGFSPLQLEVNQHNYTAFFDDILKIIATLDDSNSISVHHRRSVFSGWLLSTMKNKPPCWPGISRYLRERLDFATHKLINEYWQQHGEIPYFKLTAENTAYAQQLRRQFVKEDEALIVFNVRQRRNYEFPVAINRDSNWQAWFEFLKWAQAEHPKYKFAYLGSPLEWDRHLLEFENVVIPRMHGLSVSDELQLLLASDAFLGTSSGFSALATFSDRPYVITNYMRASLADVGVASTANTYPFAHPGQILDFEMETAERLIESCRFLSQHIKIGGLQ